MTLALEYDPKGFIEKVGDALGVVSRRVEGDLERFKRFIEERGSETGAWRGEVHPGDVHPRPAAEARWAGLRALLPLAISSSPARRRARVERAVPERRRGAAAERGERVAVRVEGDVAERDHVGEAERDGELPRGGGVGLGDPVEQLWCGHRR